MDIKLNIDHSLKLPDGQWFAEPQKKRNIFLHHTVGGSTHSTFSWWVKDPQRIGTAYIVDRDGIIFEIFTPSHWAHHLGKGSTVEHNKHSIGIEMTSEGALRSGTELNQMLYTYGIDAGRQFDEDWLYAFDIDPDQSRPQEDWFTRARKLYSFEHNHNSFIQLDESYRGYTFFDGYENAQMISVAWLSRKLCEDFSIPKQLVADKTTYNPALLDSFSGILGHCNVRPDKTDPHPRFRWDILEQVLKAVA